MRIPFWTSRLFLICASILLAAGYWLGGYVQISLALAILPIIGLITLWRGWGWVLSILLAIFSGLAAAGFYLDVEPAWLVLGIVAALVAWDQEHLSSRIKSAGRIDSQAMLIRKHWVRLVWVCLAGLLLVGLTYLIQVEFTFGLAVVLAILAVIGLSQGIAFLRRSGAGW
jgi:hypothetical protein